MRGTAGGRLLVVDDEPAVRELLAQFLEGRGYVVHAAGNSDEALERIEQGGIDVVLSDVRMPGMDGLALLAEIRRRRPEIAVLMVTGCEDVSMAVEAMKSGALDYVVKPFRLEDVETAVSTALNRSFRARLEADRLRGLELTVERQAGELQSLLDNLVNASGATIQVLAAALDARERETQSHSRRVAEYAVVLGERLGVRGRDLEILRQGAMLHDIGKIGVPDHVLLKPEPLTEHEWHLMRRHPEIGFRILDGVEHLRPAARIVLCHHERFDGFGYPARLAGESIPLGARIFSVVDTLDAITSERPYHRGFSFEAAREEIAAERGAQFDPSVVDEFLAVPAARWSAIRGLTIATNLPQLVT